MSKELVTINGLALNGWANFIVDIHADSIKQQVLFRFDNNYGASVIRGPHTYGGYKGLFELAVVRFDGNKHMIVYDTSITYDVLGWLTGDDVFEKLAEIQSLPMNGNLIEGE